MVAVVATIEFCCKGGYVGFSTRLGGWGEDEKEALKCLLSSWSPWVSDTHTGTDICHEIASKKPNGH